MGFAADDRLGNYRIVRPLGEGGMATVYEVEHIKALSKNDSPAAPKGAAGDSSLRAMAAFWYNRVDLTHERTVTMSYTMTFDFPQRTASYVERQGERFRDELNALVVAIISTKMQYDPEIVAEPVVTSPKNDFSCFFGKARLEGDAVAIQRSLREEW